MLKAKGIGKNWGGGGGGGEKISKTGVISTFTDLAHRYLVEVPG